MKFRHALTVAAISIAAAGGPAVAQSVQENRDADALAADMRLLAANPLDIEALITAGEITLRMGDTTASATFFGRAERLDPLNPRVKAGLASLMLRAERPGEALRRFREAEARGLNPRQFAADRGLAYDLLGEQERAQRDYRLALQAGPDDEVTRRYALSLGISGRGPEAMKLLEPLLRRSDRAAWRDRAFILAMTGDREGAQKIANSMMSPGLGAGLAPFFQRLPLLAPADRAYAVTFGELRASPERIADARLAPPMPKLGPDPTAPKVAAAELAPVRVVKEDKRKKRKGRDEKAMAAVTPPPVEVAAALPPPPSALATPGRVPTPYVQPLPKQAETRVAALPSRPETRLPSREQATPPSLPAVAKTETRLVSPTILAKAETRPSMLPGRIETRPAPSVVESKPVASVGEPKPGAETPVTVDRAAARTSPPVVASGARTGLADASPPPPVAVTTTPAAPPQGNTPPVVVPPPPEPLAAVRPSPPQSGVADQPSAAEAGVPAPRSIARVSEDSVLARIIAGIDVPGSELGVAPPPVKVAPPPVPKPAPEPEIETRPEVAPETKPVPPVVAPRSKRPEAEKPVGEVKRETAATKAPVLTDARGRPLKSSKAASTDGDDLPARSDRDGKTSRSSRDAVDPKDPKGLKAAKAPKDDPQLGPDGCPLPETKGKSSTRGKIAPAPAPAKSRAGRGKGVAATNCKSADGKSKAADKDQIATKGDPARVWVQVAGGANQETLQKEWARLKTKAPDLFRGRQGWWTPLRATNRVLTGPFKSADEAQDFVNKLSRAGLSGFVFTSPKGQKVDRLAGS